MSHPVDAILDRVENVRRNGEGHTGKCPAHDDNHNSFSVSEGDGGKAVVHCHAGCTVNEIVGALGMTMADLFPARSDHGHMRPVEKPTVVDTYAYTDEDGATLYEVVRMQPKDFRQRRPDGMGGWMWKLDGIRRVPYRLPELLAANPSETVFICEGEKDADLLASLGLVATTNAGGAGKWRAEYDVQLAGLHVVILPDNDKAGRDHARAVADALSGVAATVKILDLPGLPTKGDVSDWFDHGGTLERLTELVDGTPPHEADAGTRDGWRPKAAYATISIAEMDNQTFPETEWVVDALIPRGTLVLDAGRPKAGKSLMKIDMLASIALGETFLDRATQQMGVLYVAAEDSFGIVRERVRTRFGDVRDAPFHLLPADGSFDQSLRLDDDGTTLMRLSETIDALDVGIVVLDPMRELHTAKENDADEMAMLLRPLRQLAHEKNVTIVLVHHRNKHGVDASTAVRGSSAITGSVDVVLTLDVNNDDDGDLTPAQTVTLRAEGRYGPKQRIAARLGSGLRWEVTTATPPDATLTTRIPFLLSGRGEPMTSDAIAAALPAKHGSVQNVLAALLKEGKIMRIGKGAKNAPYVYVTKRDESHDESSKKAHDESYDEYSPAMQGEMPIRHIAEGYTHGECDESFSPLLAETDVTKDDESCDESAAPLSAADVRYLFDETEVAR